MKLLTHNMLASTVRGVSQGYPLGIAPGAVTEVHACDFSKEFLVHVFPKLEWSAFVSACASLSLPTMPAEVTPASWEDESFLQQMHHNLLEVHVQEGTLICPESGRQFPVSKGIPNMLLNEDEI